MAKKKTTPATAPVTAPTENSAPASAGAVNDKKDPPPPPSRYYSFKYVAQCDYTNQMAVHNWLTNDPHFRVVWILHDKDVYTESDVDKDWKNGVYVRKNEDGTTSEFRVGDTKPAHIHGYVRVQTKVTEATMKKRFGNYLFFDGVSDSYATLIYFTHSDFVSRIIDKKHQYPETDLRGDYDLYKDNCKKIAVSDNFGALMSIYCDYVKKTGTHTRAVQALLRDGRTDVLADIRKNSGFYATFLPRTGKETEEDFQTVYGAQEPTQEPVEPAQEPTQEPVEPAQEPTQEPVEPAQEPTQEPVPLSVAMYGKEDCRSASPVCRCVVCGRKLHEISFSHTWASRGELVGVCGSCYKG